ncbi:HAMP domain-containing sensor histidine kinase [Sporosarcina sp. GW1-11]|uniref:HAMP domain-containing sensor histidine kinase n=1 Tax=Sporosarcina sp. GW1-11 TaxID=2899126 RepID=UPI00294C39CD|nr:HAMP domain-containing sensor histidine kinase [Sporosarcina sp. GW1-11]MDV6377766.1 HAMP domain-containing sensor histidine kinase [Sporosarcina sp. GW1-11]
MRSAYNYQFKKVNVGNTDNHDTSNDQLQKASTSLLTNDEMMLVGKLAAGVAHEIKNPLTSIKGLVQLLNMGVNKPEYYSMIYSEINKVEEIINRLVGLAETQSVNFCINDIGLILERTITRMNDLALPKSIKIISSLEGTIFSSYCDEAQLQQVFENIIKNAIEASACNKKIYITCKTDESHVHIRVKDQGVGIPDEKIVYLFQPFYCKKKNSTGFGLMISDNIIKEHNGTIEVKSELEMGTTVDIYLPLVKSYDHLSQQLQ